MDIECGGFIFSHNFDSGNLGRIELINRPPEEREEVDFEFNLWTRPDCADTEYENGNRTWFYFGIRGGVPFSQIKINVMNLNKQSKMYAQGMCPVYRVSPGRPKWERIREKPVFGVEDNEFVLSFKHRLQDSFRTTVYFAFTYPFSYADLQTYLSTLEMVNKLKINYRLYTRLDDIYYHRECISYSLEKRRIDLLTISSYHNLTQVREPRLKNLFPDLSQPRPFRFIDKKVIFLSARVHPGETPSSFVLNGILSVLVSRDDPVGQILRRHFVFKIIPMLNPDGVYAGNYRTDTRGVNLNRVYNNPSLTEHPSIYAARAVLRYCHHGYEVQEEETDLLTEILHDKSDSKKNSSSSGALETPSAPICSGDGCNVTSIVGIGSVTTEPRDSGLFLYIDMHGHASKKGIFMYGNHFDSVEENVECMLLPKLASLNSQHFHFDSCNFSEKNMYLKDRKDGMSREGCGRVAVLKATGLIRSYTLECNYNTGKYVNQLSPPMKEPDKKANVNYIVPPKYTPQVYEDTGRSILISILDLCTLNPNSRLNASQYRSINGVREWLRHRAQAETTVTLHKQKFASSQKLISGLHKDLDESQQFERNDKIKAVKIK